MLWKGESVEEREKHEVADNFMQARGRIGKRQYKNLSSIVCLRRHFPRRGKQERGLVIKRLFEEKMPDCCSAAPHHLALQGASPQGEGLERGNIKTYPLSSAYADTFPERESKNVG